MIRIATCGNRAWAPRWCLAAAGYWYSWAASRTARRCSRVHPSALRGGTVGELESCRGRAEHRAKQTALPIGAIVVDSHVSLDGALGQCEVFFDGVAEVALVVADYAHSDSGFGLRQKPAPLAA